ncbi:hypothetical protein [Burkholderia gladioli]|uniref:hypothetical protein n=4 Tax=Burkholderia gladioli TaxID=28095 RepID=UPI00163F2DF9|nr:hypothetical protein [Burkholderia gladioli]MBU9172894.1 hypothetical protein [Burkholderia gladioli]MBU9385646.1 hypothetical protein [Burkholderia gladioli]MDN7728312.1 hypothetical protein [Burkholderia gladioli]MDN7807293.1 hypothetical protein [Burkholderia gladioli]
MKYRILGRKDGSTQDMVLLVEGGWDIVGDLGMNATEIEELSVAMAGRLVQMLRQRDFEGYVLFAGDATPHVFTPAADFIYLAARLRRLSRN